MLMVRAFIEVLTRWRTMGAWTCFNETILANLVATKLCPATSTHADHQSGLLQQHCRQRC
jgi:hypothetical protein